MGVAFLKDPMFQRFSTERPIAVMTQMTLTHLLDADGLNQVFADNAEQQYEHSLMFSTLAQLVGSVVLGKNASINAGYRKMQDQLGVSITATYGKLQRVEPKVSQAFVRDSFQKTVDVQRVLGGVPRHDIAGYETRTLDGNHLSGTEHRLKETRDITAAPLPGKSLVVMSPRYDAICDYFPIEDGHAQERSELDAVLDTIRRDQLWLADRNFCTLKFLYGIASRGAVFVIRQHGQLVGQHSGRLKKIGKTTTGTVYEQTFTLPDFGGDSLTIRRVVIKLNDATRDGETEIALLTNVPAERADALAIADVYRTRWKIETAFQHLTEAMNCEINSLCYPPAALFCFANALVAYNALSLVKSAIAAAHSREVTSSLSHYYLALEIAETTDGLLIALPAEEWSAFASLPSSEFASSLSRIAAHVNPVRYKKSVRGPKKPKVKKKHNKRSVHVSTKKLLDQRTN